MVSAYSQHPDVAADLVKYLTSRAQQESRALAVSTLPTRPAVYQEPNVLAAYPWFANMVQVFENAVARPSTVTGASYGEVSDAFFTEVHMVLTGQKPVDQALSDLEKRLQTIKQEWGW
jgi:trehalose/maltose transport system substrate-binding protein